MLFRGNLSVSLGMKEQHIGNGSGKYQMLVLVWSLNGLQTFKRYLLAVNCTKEDLDLLTNSKTDVTLLGYNGRLVYGTTYKYEYYSLTSQYLMNLRYECNEDGKSFEDPVTGKFSKYHLATCEFDSSWNTSSIPACECRNTSKVIKHFHFNFWF